MGRFAVYAAFAIGLSCEAAVSEDARIISETKLPSTEQIRKNGQNLAAQQLAARQKLLSRSPAGHLEVRPSAEGITNANCVTITLIDLRGVTLLSEEERIEILKPYVQQCIGLKSIDELMRDVTRVYFSKGYLAARVYLPPQRIEDGQLDLQIEEGVVEALTFNGDFERKQGTLQSLFPDHIGKPVNLRTVEQGIEFINRLPSSRAAIELVAGTKPGHTIINLKDAPERPVRFSMSTDNEGTKSSGVIGTKYNATFDSPFGRYDQLQISYGFTGAQAFKFNQKPERSESLSLSYSIPYGKTLYRFSASRFTYDNWIIPDPGTPYGTSGETKSFNLGAERTIFRDQTKVIKLNAGLSKSISDSFLITFGVRVPIEVQSRSQSGLSLGVNYNKRFEKGQFSSGLTYKRAIFLPGITDAAHISFGEYQARYQLLQANIGYSRLISLGRRNLLYSLSFVGQKSDDNLISAQGFAIGGKYSVRGTRESYAAGPTGYYIQNSFLLPFNQFDFARDSKLFSGMMASFGLDYGRIEPSYEYAVAEAHGLSVGLQSSWENLSFELSAERMIGGFDREAIAQQLGITCEELHETKWYLTLEAKL
jgi:hemolysin activation/secretion protein